jgi:hypothetical protein
VYHPLPHEGISYTELRFVRQWVLPLKNHFIFKPAAIADPQASKNIASGGL